MIALVDRILRLRRSYRQVFLRGDDGTPDLAARAVLADLAKFCRAHRTTIQRAPTSGAIDPVAMGVAEGRREVFLRISRMIHLDDADIHRLLNEGTEQ